MTRNGADLKLDGHAILGTIKLFVDEQDQPSVRATLDILKLGPLRSAFNDHIRPREPVPFMRLEGVGVESDAKTFIRFRVKGEVLNTKYPNTTRGIFQSAGKPEVRQKMPMKRSIF